MAASRPDSFIHPALYIEDVPQDVLAMYIDYLEGATIAEVATRHERTPGRVGELFAECGLQKRRGGLTPALPPMRPPEAEPFPDPSASLTPVERRREVERRKNERRKEARRVQREERERLRLARIV